MATKQEIRALMRARQNDWIDKDPLTLWRRAETLPAFENARTLLLYMSIPGEVPTREFIDRWCPRKQIAIPLVRGTSLELHRYDADSLVEGYYGIMEPSEDSAIIAPEEVDLAFVPGVAFTPDGKRLGRGGGFYDRLLPLIHCPRYGVCWNYRILQNLPTDEWDITMDGILTENSLMIV